MKSIRGCALRCLLAASLVLLAAFTRDASAQIWTGLGADDNWSTGANWLGGTAPASSSTTSLTFQAPAPRQSTVVDAPWTVNQMVIFGGFQFSGQPITFAGTNPHIQFSALSITIANPIVLTAGLDLFAPPSGLELDGGITGTGGLGLGGLTVRYTLRGVSTYTGGTAVGPGTTLIVGGTVPGPVTLTSANAVLGGAGTISGPVIVNGSTSFAPGAVIAGILDVGDLTLAGNMLVTIAGTAQGTQYSSASVAGTVDLTGSSLSLSGTYVPVPGDVFTLIANDATDPVVGTFAGLPEGATVNLNGMTLRLSYVGGTGNDVTLTAVAPVVPAAIPQVPTLSEWALVLLAMGVLAAGASRVRRR